MTMQRKYLVVHNSLKAEADLTMSLIYRTLVIMTGGTLPASGNHRGKAP